MNLNRMSGNIGAEGEYIRRLRGPYGYHHHRHHHHHALSLPQQEWGGFGEDGAPAAPPAAPAAAAPAAAPAAPAKKAGLFKRLLHAIGFHGEDDDTETKPEPEHHRHHHALSSWLDDDLGVSDLGCGLPRQGQLKK